MTDGWYVSAFNYGSCSSERIVSLIQRRREIEESKLRAEYETKHARYQSYLERLERKAGSSFVMGDDGPPDQIDSMYDELEEPDEAAAVFARVTANEAGWLAYYIRTRAEKEHERNREEIERELEVNSPQSCSMGSELNFVL